MRLKRAIKTFSLNPGIHTEAIRLSKKRKISLSKQVDGLLLLWMFDPKGVEAQIERVYKSDFIPGLANE